MEAEMPAPIKRDLDIELLRLLFTYDPETGVLKWRMNRSGNAKAGDVAGCVKRNGYIYIGVCGRIWTAHRLAWAIHYGRHPGDMLDHINRIKTDNRIANLRECTAAENAANKCFSPRALMGTRPTASGKWLAQIGMYGKHRHLGTFASEEEASRAYKKARAQYEQELQRQRTEAA